MSRIVGRRVVRLDVVASTMDLVWDLAAASEPEGTVVVAREQTQGRGRAGRSWQTPPGTALLFSVLLRPEVPAERLSTFALVAAVGVAEAIEERTALKPRLKWPNDVWVDERKVAGILVASRIAGGPATVVLGIGLNVNQMEDDLPQGAMSLRMATGQAQDLDALLGSVLGRLDEGYQRFVRAAGRADLGSWRKRAALIGERVTIEDGGAVRTGVFEGVDEGGALLLRTGEDEVFRVVAGDLARGPRRSG